MASDKNTNKARQYKPRTVRKLDTLSGNKCAAPGCPRALIARDKESIVSKICHIEAANPKGPRYNPSMSDDDRRHFNNLILLCDECHIIIDNKDNESKYPVQLLKDWKMAHESKQIERLNSNTSLLSQAISAISQCNFDAVEQINSGESIPFDIQSKISYTA